MIRKVLASLSLLLVSTLAITDVTTGADQSRITLQHSSLSQDETTGDRLASALLQMTRDLGDQGQISLRRNLAVGDFEEFNSLFQTAVLKLPDATVSEKVIGITLTLDLKNLLCTNVNVGDIQVTYNKESSQRLTYQVTIVDLDMDCTLDYDYDYGFLDGSGSASGYTDNNQAVILVAFNSSNFDESPPTSIAIESCSADLNVSDLDFNGGFISSILDTFERLIRGTVESQVAGVVCDELGSLGTSFVQNFIDLAAETLNPYLQPLGTNVTDPLTAEKALQIPNDMVLLDFQDNTSDVSSWFNTALDEADSILGSSAKDPNGPNGTGRDLGINTFLRDYVLDKDRALSINVDNLPFGTDGILFQSEDKLTSTVIQLNSIKILGLDTFSKFDTLMEIGQYTLQNALALSYLTVELDITFDIKPSTKSDSVIQNPSTANLVERVKITFGVDQIEAVVSLLLAIDLDAFGNLQIGPLLDTSTLLSCLLSTIFDVELSGLSVSIGSVRAPTLSGFVSAGIDRVVTTSVEAVFLMYEAVLLNAMPNIFQTTVRDILNKNVLKSYAMDPDNRNCPALDFGEKSIDFRDLFLKPSLSEIIGGSGDEPYGSLASTLMTLVQDKLSSIDSDGLPSINSFLIRPFTKAQSGTAGTLRFPSDLFAFAKSDRSNGLLNAFGQSLRLKAFNTRIRHLDTIAAPISVIQPSADPYVLTNVVNIGPVSGRPLNGTIRLLISIEGDDSPINMRNEVDISAAVSSSSVTANILANVNANALMQFPLRDILNRNCWLAMFPAPALDEDGIRVDPSSDVTLALKEFSLFLSSLSLAVTCVNCTSSGVSALPELIGILEETGSIRDLQGRFNSFADEILLSTWVQTQLDQMLTDAPKFCPHMPDYDPNATATDFGSRGFPSLSKDSVTTLVYTAAMVADAAVVVVAESHLSYAVNASDALSGQNVLTVPENVSLLNLTDLGNTVGRWVDTALKKANEYLNGNVNDSNGPNGKKDLGINVLLRSLLLDTNRALSMKFDDVSFDAGETQIVLTEIRVLGLDTFTKFNALEAIAPQTLSNQFGWEQLGIDVDVSIRTDSSTDGEVMTLSFGLRDVNASLGILLAFNQDLLGSMELGSLITTNHVLPCLLSTALAVELTELDVAVGGIEDWTLKGFLSKNVSAAIDASTKAVLDEYGDKIVGAMPAVFDVTIRALVNNWIRYYLGLESSVSCPKLEVEQSAPAFVDFRDLFLPESAALALGGSGNGQYGDVFRGLRSLITNQVLKIDATDGQSAVNDLLIAPLTRGQSGIAGSFVYDGNILNTGTKLNVGGLDARIELKAYNVRIENMDTVGAPLSLLDPVPNRPDILNNTASFGIGSDPLRFSIRFLMALLGDDDMQLSNEVDISLDLSSATVVLGALLRIAEDRLAAFPMRDIQNFDCWLATLPAPQLDARGIRVSGSEPSAALAELAVSIARMKLNVTCVSCSSPNMKELTSLLSSPEAADDVTDVANKLLGYATDLLGGEFLQVQIDRLLNDAPKRCPHREEYEASPAASEYEPFEAVDQEDGSVSFLIALIAIGGCIIVSVTILSYVIRWIVRRRHVMWLRSLPGSSIAILYKQQKDEREKEAELNRLTKSMFRSEAVPVLAKWLVPVVVVANIALFLSGHLSLGATVNIEAQLAGEKFTVDKFFEFSMAKSTVDIWNAGGKELAIIILIFSGIWPYTKQLILLALWFLPPRLVSISRRGSIYLWLDALGKWSIVDIFVLLVSIAAFRVTIASPDVAFLPDDFYSVNLLVIPLWGLYANLIAQLVSQISSHFIIHYHRRIVGLATVHFEQSRQVVTSETFILDDDSMDSTPGGTTTNQLQHEGMDCSRLHEHAFARVHRGQSDKLQLRRRVNYLVVAIAIVLAIFVIVGCSLPSFSLDVLGVLGVAVESGQGFKDAVTEHSVFTMASLLMDEARFLGAAKDYIGLGTLSSLLVISVFIVPLFQILTLLRQWFAPMDRKARSRLSILNEGLQAWQYMEVYALAVVISAWQLGPISEFMINAYCDGLEDTFATLVYYGILEPNDAQCFKVEAGIDSAMYLLIVAAVLLVLLNSFVMKAVFQFERDEDSKVLEDGTKLIEMEESPNFEEVSQMISSIAPAPVLFTDTFRWLLRSENADDANMQMGLDDEAKLGVDKGFPDHSTVRWSVDVGDVDKVEHIADAEGIKWVESDASGSVTHSDLYVD